MSDTESDQPNERHDIAEVADNTEAGDVVVDLVDLVEAHDAMAESERPDPRRVIEAILMVADQPVEPVLLGELTGLAVESVDDLLLAMATDYRSEARGFDLVRVAGGWRYQSASDLTKPVERFALQGQVARLSAAALETLAIVAYRQPISRTQISLIRGVSVDGVMKTLVQRGYVMELGIDSGPGQAVLYGTSPRFLESLGMDSLANLPAIGDFVPGSEIMDALEAGLSMSATPAANGATDEVEPVRATAALDGDGGLDAS
jgi:segregation and condensation protein B